MPLLGGGFIMTITNMVDITARRVIWLFIRRNESGNGRVGFYQPAAAANVTEETDGNGNGSELKPRVVVVFTSHASAG